MAKAPFNNVFNDVSPSHDGDGVMLTSAQMYEDPEQGPTLRADYAERLITIDLTGCTMTAHAAAAVARKLVDEAIRDSRMWPELTVGVVLAKRHDPDA